MKESTKELVLKMYLEYLGKHCDPDANDENNLMEITFNTVGAHHRPELLALAEEAIEAEAFLDRFKDLREEFFKNKKTICEKDYRMGMAELYELRYLKGE